MRSVSVFCVIGVVYLAVYCLVAFQTMPFCFAADLDEAEAAVAEAEWDVRLTFVAIENAEVAGADVSAAMVKLDLAGALLSEAKYAFSIQDYDAAVLASKAVSNTLEEVIDDVKRLEISAEELSNESLFFKVICLVAGVGFVSFSSFFGWRLLKRWYLSRIFDNKAETESSS